MDFTGAFDNMPDCMVVVKRNLDREDGFEEVYLNKAFKNKKSLTDSFESNVLLKIFRDRYDEIKMVISDIFAGIKKAEIISLYNEELGGNFSAQFYIAGEPEYCICIFREEFGSMENKSLKCAYDISKVANEAKSAFLKHMGQYMKTPVNYIIGITDMLWTSKKYYHDNDKYISKIRNASDVLLENINRMLDVSRIAVGDTRLLYEKISISELIEEIIGEIEEDIIEKGHELIVNMDDISQDNVYTDKMRLKQAIKNIVLNAVKYTYKNGIIKVTVIEGKQKFGNGYWIGLTAGVCPGCLSVYHFVPFAFVGGILLTTILSILGYPLLGIIMWSMYGVLAVAMALLAVAGETKKHGVMILLPLMFLYLHVLYGVGTWIGLLRMPFWREKHKECPSVERVKENMLHESDLS